MAKEVRIVTRGMYSPISIQHKRIIFILIFYGEENEKNIHFLKNSLN
jgi:hypothetical protein